MLLPLAVAQNDPVAFDVTSRVKVINKAHLQLQ